MKSSIFVTFSSLLLLSWLALSFVTSLKPETRTGRGALPLADAAKKSEASGAAVISKSEAHRAALD